MWAFARRAVRLPAEGVAVSTAVPTAQAIRRPSRRVPNRIVWLVRKCPFCGRTHAHAADPVMTEVIAGAPCARERFYRLELEAEPGA